MPKKSEVEHNYSQHGRMHKVLMQAQAQAIYFCSLPVILERLWSKQPYVLLLLHCISSEMTRSTCVSTFASFKSNSMPCLLSEMHAAALDSILLNKKSNCSSSNNCANSASILKILIRTASKVSGCAFESVDYGI